MTIRTTRRTARHHYRVFGRRVESDLRLSLFLPFSEVRKGEASITVLMSPQPTSAENARTVYDAMDYSGKLVCSLKWDGERYHWHYPGLANYVVHPDGTRISWSPETGENAEAHRGRRRRARARLLRCNYRGSSACTAAPSSTRTEPTRSWRPPRSARPQAAALMAHGCKLLTDGCIALDASGPEVTALPGRPR